MSVAFSAIGNSCVSRVVAESFLNISWIWPSVALSDSNPTLELRRDAEPVRHKARGRAERVLPALLSLSNTLLGEILVKID